MATVLGKVISRGIATTRVANGQAAVSGHHGKLVQMIFYIQTYQVKHQKFVSCCGHVHQFSVVKWFCYRKYFRSKR